ncbi:MAG: hypothetical protein ACE5GJ_09860, partial [Gemmatimonadota bacterium]
VLLMAAVHPVAAQECRGRSAPDIRALFPDSVNGLGRQFYNRLGDCYTNLYKPSEGSGSTPWAVVSIEPNSDKFLGDTADGLAQHYTRAGTDFIRVDGWPVAFSVVEDLGDEFVTLKGPVRITVLIKEGDAGERSRTLATAFLRAILPSVPCEG